MKIIIVRTVPGEIKYSLGTYNEQYIGLARALISKGHQCDIICSSDDGQERTKIIPVDGGHEIKLYCVKATIVMKNAILHFDSSILDDYDIVQTIEYNQLYTWYLAGKCKNKNIIYHGPYYSSFNKRYNLMARFFDMFFLNRYIKNNTKFITKSRLAEEYLRNKGIKNVSSVGVGLDIKSLEPTSEMSLHSELGEKMKCINADYMMLYIGRIEPRRNSLFLIDILKKLREQGENVCLTVVGTGAEDYIKSFFQKVTEYNLNDYILYEPKLEQKFLAEIYGNADIFLLPTNYDIYGMVLLESMYYGLPTISSPCGGAQMMIENWNNGVVVDGFDVCTWCDSILQILLNKDTADKLGEQAHKKIIEEFTWNSVGEKIVEEYISILEENIEKTNETSN